MALGMYGTRKYFWYSLWILPFPLVNPRAVFVFQFLGGWWEWAEIKGANEASWIISFKTCWGRDGSNKYYRDLRKQGNREVSPRKQCRDALQNSICGANIPFLSAFQKWKWQMVFLGGVWVNGYRDFLAWKNFGVQRMAWRKPAPGPDGAHR